VRLTWAAPKERAPAGYIVLRDGQELGSTLANTYGDLDAPAPTIIPPNGILATDGTSPDKVSVSWQAASALPGKPAKYTVLAVYNQGGGVVRGLPSNEATGNRAGASIAGYDLRRDNGPWLPAGTGTNFEDLEAPKSSLSGVLAPTAQVRGPSSLVLRVSFNNAQITNPAPSTYLVRARFAGGRTVEALTADTGFVKRPQAFPSIQWQRSADDSDANYTDVPGMTGSVWYDPTPASGPRYYRPRFAADGLASTGTAVRVAAVAATFKSVSQASQDHACGIKTDDTVTCWGTENNGWNRIASVPVGVKFKRIATGYYSACGIRADDTPVCWGLNSYTSIPAGVTTAKDVAMANSSYCFINQADAIGCQNTSPPSGTFKRISAAYSTGHFCGIKSDDTVACWGGLTYTGPVGLTFKAVTTGDNYGCGITQGNKLVCWGNNNGGQAPTGPSVEDYKDVSARETGTCAIRMDDTVECFGPGSEGMFVGRSDTKFKSLNVGYRTVCGVDMADRYWCLPSRNTYSAPGEVAPSFPAKGAKALAFSNSGNAGEYGCIIRSDDKRICFGAGNMIPSLREPSADTYKAIAVRGEWGCGIKGDDTLACWSFNGSLPAQLPATTVEKYKVLGRGYGPVFRNKATLCAVRADESIQCFSQVGLAGLSGQYKAVAHTQLQVCGIKSADGGIVCGGNTEYNVLSTLPQGTGFQSIEASMQHGGFCAVDASNKRICWGRTVAATTVPSMDDFKSYGSAIYVSGNWSCGLRLDGRRLCEGGNVPLQLQGSSADTWLSVLPSRTRNVACGVRGDGAVYCEGAGNFTPPVGLARF
jgi:hypothetical protein